MIEKKKTGTKKKRKSHRKSHSEIEGNETENQEEEETGKQKKRKRGRPGHRLTWKERERIRCLFEIFGTIQGVAVMMKIPVSTLRDRIAKIPGFSDEIEDLRDGAAANAIKAWYSLAVGARVPETKVFQYFEKEKPENPGEEERLITKWKPVTYIREHKPDIKALQSFLRYQNLRKNKKVTGKLVDELSLAVQAFDEDASFESPQVQTIFRFIDATGGKKE